MDSRHKTAALNPGTRHAMNNSLSGPKGKNVPTGPMGRTQATRPKGPPAKRSGKAAIAGSSKLQTSKDTYDKDGD